MTKIDITSTAVEKGVEAAKEFLEKLTGPALEETGLLIKDKITYWRFKNQVKMINKAQNYCVNNNISPKSIPFKMLYPVMEYSALEESNELQDKWAILLSNMVDSEQNIENHVFPYILSQISVKEFQIIESLVHQRFKERENWNSQLKEELEATKFQKAIFDKEISELNSVLKNLPADTKWKLKYKVERSLRNKEGLLRDINSKSNRLRHKIKSPIVIPDLDIEDFEFANMRRLGLVKGISKQIAFVNSSEISFDGHYETVSLDDLDIVIEHDYEEYMITQLGEMFIDVCTEKKKKV